MIEMLGRLWRMSLQASVMILFVLAVRPFLKRYPKVYSYSLWILVGISLLCPISIRSPFSLQPALPDTADFLGSGQRSGSQSLTLQGNIHDLMDISGTDADTAPIPGIPANNGESGNFSGGAAQAAVPTANQTEPDSKDVLLWFLCTFYLAGTGAVLFYCFAQYLRVHRRIATAIRESGNVWLCEAVQSPFVIGIRKPRILLPYGLSESEKAHILLHERTHIRHHDALARLISLICVCLHWWNPLVWYAARLMEQDMEMFCDESSLEHADLSERKAYAKTLLSCASRQSRLTIGPAFGESNTERRVENIMKKRKNNLIVLCGVILLAVFCAVAFMTIPDTGKRATEPQEAPVYFGDFALAGGAMYMNFPEDEISDTRLALPVTTNYCAIYKNRLYYSTDEIDPTIDYVTGGHLTIYSCKLDGTDQKKILDIPEIYSIFDMVLRDDSLYCSYIKTEDDDACIVTKVSISGENLTEYSLAGDYGGLFLFYKNRAYTRAFAGNREIIFYVHDLDTGRSEELYRCSGYFLENYCIADDGILLLLGNNDNLTLLRISEDKSVTDYGNFEGQTGQLFSGQSSYCGIGSMLYQLDKKQDVWIPFELSLPEHIQPYGITPIMEEGDNLYCLISGNVPDNEWYNTFLLRFNTESGESTLLREFYLP